ncbi:hypothetical protein [Bartonella vinsonii]|uniref:Uncharacterized protein n=1 Tax=Bartonella vinsonii TaxID=33047 RepID=A0A3S4YHY3_BARVI|nr:hypothetical protein [Bartonella vinsonii]VEJ46009.1 Uncharacterised protein [Bartonella vinsonii]VEJ46160.1 Uncharacterised protein [Bartonella vinsonii]
MWFIIKTTIIILIVLFVLDAIAIPIIYGIGLLVRGIFNTLGTILNAVGNVLLTIILPTLETIDYALTKDKSEWNKIIEERKKFKEYQSIKKENGEETINYYFRLVKRGLFLFLSLMALFYFAAAITLIIMFSTVYILASCFPHSSVPYFIGTIILILSLPLTVCMAPVQYRIQALPVSFLLQTILLWIQFCKILSINTVLYIIAFEIFIYILFSFSHLVFITEISEKKSTASETL